ncbi:isoprenylcysteine carboxylmethyltransferase family protein [Patescibacteria group bacterium]|nr:isoprenylcysteine carboxylmethyltransferase family protein [Patescibacteria group bacterium]MBU0963986.1 isoprenylcysteine carboxylmethyltransferase family protein [Patescibacteria group bacterium]
MGPIILIAVLLHALSSCWQLWKLPKGMMRRQRTEISLLVRTAVSIKEFEILPIIVLALLFYSFVSSAAFWLTIESFRATWVEIIGLVFIVLSIPLKVLAYAALGRNWSAKPTIYEDHTLITEGPYAWVRHPVYTSNMIMILGVFMGTSSVTLLILGICYLATDIVRANEEEKKLTFKFDGAYVQYAENVGKYVPFAVTLTFAGIVVLCNILGIVGHILSDLMGIVQAIDSILG